jgi:DNA-binding transcriptional regulator YhcF (GntR family)
VARAYRLLDEAGLISTQQGRGTYIWEAPSAEGTQLLRQQALEGLTRRYLAEVSRLGCSPDDVVTAFEQQMVAWKAGDPPEETS